MSSFIEKSTTKQPMNLFKFSLHKNNMHWEDYRYMYVLTIYLLDCNIGLAELNIFPYLIELIHVTSQ